MKNSFVGGVLFVLFTLLFACGDEGDWQLEPGATASTEAPIINGQKCDEETYPATVAILSHIVVDLGQWGGTQDIKSVSCTGTLIAPDTVLSAAHCVDPSLMTMGLEVESVDYYISFEADLGAMSEDPRNAEIQASAIRVASWIGHPDFTIDAMQNVDGPGTFYDIGLLFLEVPIDTVEPAIVIAESEDSQMQEGGAIAIVGWGQQTPQGGGWMQQPPPGTVGIKICADSFINEIGETEMQVGGSSETSRKCHGDSGGPSYMMVETSTTRKERVVGVTSHAYDASDCAKGGVDTRLDSWRAWVDQEMVKACSDGTRSWCEVAGVIPPAFYDPASSDELSGGVESGCDCAQTNSASAWLFLILLGVFFRASGRSFTCARRGHLR